MMYSPNRITPITPMQPQQSRRFVLPGAAPTYHWLRLVGGGVLALVWEVAARAMGSPIFPPLSQVVPALWRLVASGAALQHTLVSLQHIGIGFCLAALVGVGLGIGMTWSRIVDALVMPVVDSVRPVAALTIFPLLILLLGLGLWSKVFVIFWTAWPPILLSTVQSIRQVNRAVLDAAQLDGAGSVARLRYITLPLAAPGTITGLRIGMSTGWISLVAAEMLGATSGLGYTVIVSSQTFQFPTMYATILLIALIGLAMNTVLAVIQHVVEERVCA